MTQIKLTFDGEPVSAGRPRFARRGNYVSTYDPPKSKQAKQVIASLAKKEATGELIEGPIMVEAYFYKAMPKAFSKTKKKQGIDGTLRPVTKPDTDNYVKLLLDAINGIFYKDDNQVVDVIGHKYYTDKPRTEIIITSLD